MFSFELDFLKWLEGLRTGFLNGLFQAITILGEETLMILLVVTLWFAVNKRLAHKLLFITVSSLCVNGVVKCFAKVPRPFTKGVSCVRADTATGYSFPSGHTQGFATWGTVILIKYKKVWLSIITGLLILLVGFSRLYLGAHYPSDVIVGLVLGVAIGFLGNFLFEKVRDTKKLYLVTTIAFVPFIVYFLIEANPLFADLYKTFGMLGGLTVVAFLDEKCKPLSYDVPWWKKLLRIVIGVALAYALKEGIKALNVFDIPQISLLFDSIRYVVVVFAVGFLCPMLFKKIKL